jgi:cytochrome c
MKTTLAMAALAVAAMAQAVHAQDVAAGEQSFKKCFPCHSIGEGAKNKVGPELNGLDGRHSGSAPAFNYSDANKNSGIVWGEATFKEYIKDPRAKIPGTKMIFPRHQERDGNRQSVGLSQAVRPGRKEEVTIDLQFSGSAGQ